MNHVVIVQQPVNVPERHGRCEDDSDSERDGRMPGPDRRYAPQHCSAQDQNGGETGASRVRVRTSGLAIVSRMTNNVSNMLSGRPRRDRNAWRVADPSGGYPGGVVSELLSGAGIDAGEFMCHRAALYSKPTIGCAQY